MKNNRLIAKIMTAVLALSIVLNPGAANMQAKSKKVKLNKKNITIKEKKTFKLKLVKSKKKISNTKIKWKSTNKKIATVNKNGLVKAKKVGKCTVTATYKKKKYKCKVTVKTNGNSATPATKKPSSGVKPTSTPVPTVVPTPDVKKLTVKQIEEWNKDNAAYDFVKGPNGKVSFISGKVADHKVTNKNEAYKVVSAIKLLDDSDDIDLVYIETSTDMHGDIYYRFMQYINGYIINDAIAILGTDKDGNTIAYSNNLKTDTSDIEDDNMISAKKALRIVKDEVPDFEGVESIEPYISIKIYNECEKFYWTVVGKNNNEITDKDEFYPYIKYYVEVSAGEYTFCEMAKMEDGTVPTRGNEYNFPEVSTQLMEFTNAWDEKVKLPVAKNEKGKYYIIDSARKIEVLGGYDGDKGVFDDDYFTFDKPEDVSPNYVSVVENIISTYDLLGSCGYKSVDGKGEIPIKINLGFVQEGEECDNAFASGVTDGELRICAGDTIGNATFDALSHEYTHGVIQTKRKMDYNYLSGAFEESYADIIGNLAQMSVLNDKHCDKDAWTLFEMQDGSTDGAMRSMANPEEYRQPRKVGGVYWTSVKISCGNNDHASVHSNSGVLNNIAYSLFANKNINISYEDYLKVWFTTILLTTKDTKFDEIKAYLKYSMSRYSFSKNNKAIDEVFDEANANQLDEHKWVYDLEEGYNYLKIDKSNKKDAIDIIVEVYWANKDGSKGSVFASDYDDENAIAMIPKGANARVVFSVLENMNVSTLLCNYSDSVEITDKVETVKYNPDDLWVWYSNHDAWAYRPNYLDSQEEHDAEVFYVGSTATVGSDSELNMRICDDVQRDKFVSMINSEKGIYDTKTLFYAPFYRQQTVAGYSASKEESSAATDLAQYDIYDAFEEFLDSHEEGTPIVLAGSGQGAQMIKFIISCMHGNEPDYQFDKDEEKEFFDNFVAAYAPGWYFDDEFLEKNPKIKMAKGEDDTSVIVSYCAEAEDYNENTPILPAKIRTNGINPLNWKTDSTVATIEENIGACFVDGGGFIKNIIPELCGAYIDKDRGTLKVTGISKEDYPANIPGLKDGNYQKYNTALFYMNLKKNVLKRIRSFKNKK